MLETSARLLRLLSLFQGRKYWSGTDLADRLDALIEPGAEPEFWHQFFEQVKTWESPLSFRNIAEDSPLLAWRVRGRAVNGRMPGTMSKDSVSTGDRRSGPRRCPPSELLRQSPRG